MTNEGTFERDYREWELGELRERAEDLGIYDHYHLNKTQLIHAILDTEII